MSSIIGICVPERFQFQLSSGPTCVNCDKILHADVIIHYLFYQLSNILNLNHATSVRVVCDNASCEFLKLNHV